MDENASIPRRQFLAVVSGAGLSGVALLAGDVLGAPAAANDLKTLTHTMFAPYVGARFQIQTLDGQTTAPVDLVKATALPKATRARAKREAFSLLFSGPTDATVPQGTYNVKNSDLGTLSGVLVVNLGLDKKKKTQFYEVIFN